MRHTGDVACNVVVGRDELQNVGGDVHVGSAGGEVPHGVQVRSGAASGVDVAPHQLLDGVVEAQTNQLDAVLGAGAGGQLIAAGVLHLLDQVLVTLLGEAATLLSVQVHVVRPHLEGVGGAEVRAVVGRQVKVQTNLVVLQSNQGQVQTGVAVEEEQQRQVHLGRRQGSWCCRQGIAHRSHLRPGVLVGLVQEQLGIQAPPGLVVLVDTLTTDGQLNSGNSTLSYPVGIETDVVGGQNVADRGQCHVHVADQVAVTGDGHGHTTAVGRRAVGGLLDHLHRKVGVTLVHRLEKGHLGVTGQIHILSAVRDELHKSSGHDRLVLVPKKKISGQGEARASISTKTLSMSTLPMENEQMIPEDEEMQEFDEMTDPMEALAAFLATDDGDTVASSLATIAKQLEKTNVILIKMLSAISKTSA